MAYRSRYSSKRYSSSRSWNGSNSSIWNQPLVIGVSTLATVLMCFFTGRSFDLRQQVPSAQESAEQPRAAGPRGDEMASVVLGAGPQSSEITLPLGEGTIGDVFFSGQRFKADLEGLPFPRGGKYLYRPSLSDKWALDAVDLDLDLTAPGAYFEVAWGYGSDAARKSLGGAYVVRFSGGQAELLYAVNAETRVLLASKPIVGGQLSISGAAGMVLVAQKGQESSLQFETPEIINYSLSFRTNLEGASIHGLEIVSREGAERKREVLL